MNRTLLLFVFVVFVVIAILAQTSKLQPKVTTSQKEDFLRFVKTLEHKGEFYTTASVERAAPYLPVLLALDENDLKNHDLYSFGALSRGFCDKKEHRDYVIAHFDEIKHPVLKLGWAAMIFQGGNASSEIKQFLKTALKSETQSGILRELTGPEFEGFKKKVEGEN